LTPRWKFGRRYDGWPAYLRQDVGKGEQRQVRGHLLGEIAFTPRPVNTRSQMDRT